MYRYLYYNGLNQFLRKFLRDQLMKFITVDFIYGKIFPIAIDADSYIGKIYFEVKKPW